MEVQTMMMIREVATQFFTSPLTANIASSWDGDCSCANLAANKTRAASGAESREASLADIVTLYQTFSCV